MKELIELLKANEGEIVSTSSLSVEDINQARASERMYVDADGFGFVWIPPLNRFPVTEEEIENFEKWYPLPVAMPEELSAENILNWIKKKESLQSKGKTKEEAKGILYRRLKAEGHEELLFQDSNPKENGAIIQIIVEAMEEYTQSHANKDGWKDSDTVDFAIWAAAQLVNRNKLINPRLLQEFKDKYKPLPQI